MTKQLRHVHHSIKLENLVALILSLDELRLITLLYCDDGKYIVILFQIF